MRKLVLALALALTVAPAATAGGWATAGLGPPDGGIGAGDTWRAEVTIKQHGITPLVGVDPAVIITDTDGKQWRYAAKPTDKRGVYAANVKFPHGGTWKYAVDDGFSQTHQYPAIEIAGGSASTGGWSVPWELVAGAAVALTLALALVLARRYRPRPVRAAL